MRLVFEKWIEVDPRNGYVDGHFDGHSIVPGAVSLGWMLDALGESLATPHPIPNIRIQNFKCLEEIPAPCTVHLELFQKSEKIFRIQLNRNEKIAVSTEIHLPG